MHRFGRGRGEISVGGDDGVVALDGGVESERGEGTILGLECSWPHKYTTGGSALDGKGDVGVVTRDAMAVGAFDGNAGGFEFNFGGRHGDVGEFDEAAVLNGEDIAAGVDGDFRARRADANIAKCYVGIGNLIRLELEQSTVDKGIIGSIDEIKIAIGADGHSGKTGIGVRGDGG